MIYDVLGKRVKTLISSYLLSGDHVVRWDGADNGGNKVTSGIYIYQLINSSSTVSRKMTLIR